jgi:hypothetical protein
MFAFSDSISNLRLVEMPLRCMKYTWSSMQPPDPLLVRLDWFFTSNSETNNYPCTFVSTLSRDISDHVPCIIDITTEISKGKLFRFENYWMQHAFFHKS